MSKKLYKYIGPDILEIAFSKEDHCGFKCSYPKDYNDPYELFLTINFEEHPERLAFYNEIVQEIPQLPTSCFSKSPIVTPMWAHYAHNSRGFVIEVDEENLSDYIDDPSIGDVTYQNEPRSGLSETFDRAYYRGKPRDMMFLRNGMQGAAYFTKHECWSYELERRLIVTNNDIDDINDNMILSVPIDCITAIISGFKTEEAYREKARNLCNDLGFDYYETIIGRSTSNPYFLNNSEEAFVFKDGEITLSDNACPSCKEPISVENEFCSWCSITEDDENYAASGNPLRAFSDAGMLADYIRTFNSIGK